jgi:hypothetical protein
MYLQTRFLVQNGFSAFFCRFATSRPAAARKLHCLGCPSQTVALGDHCKGLMFEPNTKTTCKWFVRTRKIAVPFLMTSRSHQRNLYQFIIF